MADVDLRTDSGSQRIPIEFSPLELVLTVLLYMEFGLLSLYASRMSKAQLYVSLIYSFVHSSTSDRSSDLVLINVSVVLD